MYPSSSFGSGSNNNNNNLFTPNKPFGVYNGGSIFGGTTSGVFGQQGFGISSTPNNKPFDVNTGGSFLGGTATGVFGLQVPSTSSTPTPAPSSPIFGVQFPATQTQVPLSVGVTSQPAAGLTSTVWKFGQTQQTPASGQNQAKFPSIFTTKKFQPVRGFGKTQPVSQNGTTQFTFGVQNRANGDQVSSRGSRVASYRQTIIDGEKFMSISAMQDYQNKSHEELRWEDYELGVSVTQPVSHPNPFKITPKPFETPSTPKPFAQTPFAVSSTPNPFAQKSFEALSTPNPFAQKPFEAPSTPNPFALNPSTPNPFAQMPSTPNPLAQKPFEALSTPNPFSQKPFVAPSTPNPFAQTPSTPNPFAQKPFEAPSTPNPFAQKPLEAPSTPNPFAQKPFVAPSTPNPFAQTPSTPNPFAQKPFEAPSTPNPFAQKPLEAPSTPNPFAQKPFVAPSTPNPFAQTPSTPNPFAQKPFEAPSTPYPFAQKPLEAPSTPNPFARKPFEAPSTPNPFAPNPFSPKHFEVSATPNPFEAPSTPNPLALKPFENMLKLTKPVVEPSPNPLPINLLSPNPTPAPSTNQNQGQTPVTTDSVVMHNPTPVSNPFGTLPDMPQVSIGRSRSSTPIQYGISSIPVSDKPNPSRISPLLHDRTRVSSLLSSRRLSQRRIRVPAKIEAHQPKIPFYFDEGLAMTPSADIGIKPREDPRAYIISQTEKLHIKENMEKTSQLIGTQPENEGVTENGCDTQSPNVVLEVQSDRNKEPEVDIDALLPKLNYADYYTEPARQELAIKETAEPGFCHHVKDFVIGRHGYGSINFIGETDIQGLDLEKLVQFNSREVIVYMDHNEKPPVGQGLNKPAVVTLLNIKFFDKKTGQQYTEGPKVERCKEILVKKTHDQGAQFVSYDALKGEWKFKVNHF